MLTWLQKSVVENKNYIGKKTIPFLCLVVDLDFLIFKTMLNVFDLSITFGPKPNPEFPNPLTSHFSRPFSVNVT